MKILLILLLALPVYSQVKVNYDKFKDQTIVTSDGAHITPSIRLVVKALHKGEKPADVQYFLVFYSMSKEWKFLKTRELIFMVDNERLELGSGYRESDLSSRYAVVHEVLTYPIDLADLEKLFKASTLEMKIGFTEAKLGERDKKGMKEMLEYK